MKRVLLFCLISLVILSACSPAPAALMTPAHVAEEETQPAQIPTQPPAVATTQSAVTVIDALGREITFTEPPIRIVTTGKGVILILDAAYMFPAAPERIVAMGNAAQGTGNFISMIDPSYDTKVILQNDAGAEQIAAVKPDLVILKSYLAETVGKPIAEGSARLLHGAELQTEEGIA